MSSVVCVVGASLAAVVGNDGLGDGIAILFGNLLRASVAVNVIYDWAPGIWSEDSSGFGTVGGSGSLGVLPSGGAGAWCAAYVCDPGNVSRGAGVI